MEKLVFNSLEKQNTKDKVEQELIGYTDLHFKGNKMLKNPTKL